MNFLHQRPENTKMNTFPMQFQGFKNSRTPSPCVQIHKPPGKHSCGTNAWAVWKSEREQPASSWWGSQKGHPLCQRPPHISSKMPDRYSPSKSLSESQQTGKVFIHSTYNGYTENKAGIMKNMNRNFSYSIIKNQIWFYIITIFPCPIKF